MTDLHSAYAMINKAIEDGNLKATNISVTYWDVREPNLAKISVECKISPPNQIDNITFTASVDYFATLRNGVVVDVIDDSADFTDDSEEDPNFYPYALAAVSKGENCTSCTVMVDLFSPDFKDSVKPHIETLLNYHDTLDRLKALYVR